MSLRMMKAVWYFCPVMFQVFPDGSDFETQAKRASPKGFCESGAGAVWWHEAPDPHAAFCREDADPIAIQCERLRMM
jgi:hypothetical protein